METNPSEEVDQNIESKPEETEVTSQEPITEEDKKVDEEEKKEPASAAKREETKKMVMDYLEKMQAMQNPKDPKNKKIMKELQKYKPLYEKHEFWDTQPVPKGIAGGVDKEGEIEKGKLDEVRQEPYTLPSGFTWSDINLQNEDELNEVYELLRDHYVEDSDHMFRFDYQKDFLKWALLPPNQYSDWIFGVRGGKNNKLFGMITGVPVKLVIKGEMVKMIEINYLCVHKKIRKLRLAPVLIKEVTRRTHIKNMWQAIYTAGIVIPRPMAEATYYHRNLNTKKLLEIGFTSLPQGRPKSLHIKLLSLPKDTPISGIRPMEMKDVKQVKNLLSEYLKNFDTYFQYNKEEIAHFFLPRENVIYSYVVVDSKTDEITDFISYYSLPSTIINDEKHKTLFAAYSYYMVPKKHSINDLMKTALILARNDKFDVFNALDLMDNKQVFEELHFGVGNGSLYYYLYNWYTKKIPAPKIGTVLV